MYWPILPAALVLLLVAPAARGQGKEIELSKVVFASGEAARRSGFISSGGKLSLKLDGTYRAFALAITGISVTDLYRARQGKADFSTVNAKAQLFVGLERSFGKTHVSFGLGPSLNRFVDRRGVTRRRPGLAAHWDLWYRPDAGRLAIWTAILDSGAAHVWSRLRYGWRVAGAFVGPEIIAARDATSRKLKVGAHVSEWRLGATTLSIGGGIQRERGRTGAYASFAAYLPY